MINVAFIADENFILPTSVAVASLVHHSSQPLTVHIVTPGLPMEAKEKLNSFNSQKVSVKIYEVENDFANVSTEGLFKDIPANRTALMKFGLPLILKDVDKLLYLDGDLIVHSDISELFNIDLEDNIVAAVSDKIADWQMDKLNLKSYFNSGVMLLNLKQMREENMTEKLLDYRCNGYNCFMDQDTFNVVFKNRVKFLPFKFNTMYSIMECNTPKQIKDIYNASTVKSKEEMVDEAVVIHFSSNKKPWKYMLPGISLLYRKYVELSPYKGHEFDYIGKAGEIFDIHHFLPENNLDEVAVSIVVPAHNVQEYVAGCLDSLVNQTLKNIEIVVVDDASTDNTLKILKEYAEQDNRIKLIELKENRGTCYARKIGSLNTTGKYVMFCDSDDKFELNACEELYESMISTDADILQFKTKIINHNSSMNAIENFDKYINRSYEFLTREEIIKESFIKKGLSRNLWNRIYKGNLVRESLKYLDDGFYLKSEDMYTSLLISFNAKNMIFSNKSYYNYLIGSGITATNDQIAYNKFKNIATGIDVMACIVKYLSEHQSNYDYEELLASLFKHCYTEINWWIKFVDTNEFEQCLSYAYEKYEAILRYLDNEVVASAFAKALDDMYYSIQINDSINMEYMSKYLALINDQYGLIQKESIIYHSYVMKNKGAVNIVVNIGNNDFPYLAVMIDSLCKNKDSNSLYNINILGNGLYKKYTDKINCYNSENVIIKVINNCNKVADLIKKGVNGNLCYKTYACEILSLLGKFIYINYDSLVATDLKELFNIDIEDVAIGAVHEYSLTDGIAGDNFANNLYLINTKEFNKLNLAQLYLKSSSKLSEREFLNTALKNNVKFIDHKWCFEWHIPYKYLNGEYTSEYNIIHFGSDLKPWKAPEHQYADIFWQYARQTNFYEELIYKNMKIGVPQAKPAQQPANKKSKKPSNIKKFFKSVKEIGFKRTMKKVFRKIFKKGGKK